MLPSIQPFSSDGSLACSVANSNDETEINFKFLAEWVVNPDPIVSAIYKATERQAAFPQEIVNLVTEYLQNHEALKSLSFFGPSDWMTTFNKKVEKIQPPQEMDAFLQRINPFTGKLNAESCLCVFIPSYYQNISQNTKEEQEHAYIPLIPITPATMEELAKNSVNPKHQSKYRYFFDKNLDLGEKQSQEVIDEFLHLHDKKSYWVVITPDVIPSSRRRLYSKQKDLINEIGAKEYWQVPSIREVIICAFAHYAKTGVRMFNDDTSTYTRCVEQIFDYRTFVGGFNAQGLYVGYSRYDNGNDGVVVLRKFAF